MNPLRSTHLCGILAAFSFMIVDSAQAAPSADRQPDLRIGVSRSINMMRGNDIYNPTSAGQRIQVSPEGQRWSNFYFALENDGNKSENRIDRVRLKGTGSPRNRVIDTKYFRLTGGRRNITAQMTATGWPETLTEGTIVKYQGMVRYLSPSISRNQNVNIIARSRVDTSKVDAIRALVRPS